MDTVCKSIMRLVLIQVISSLHLVWQAPFFCVSIFQTFLHLDKNKDDNIHKKRSSFAFCSLTDGQNICRIDAHIQEECAQKK